MKVFRYLDGTKPAQDEPLAEEQKTESVTRGDIDVLPADVRSMTTEEPITIHRKEVTTDAEACGEDAYPAEEGG